MAQALIRRCNQKVKEFFTYATSEIEAFFTPNLQSESSTGGLRKAVGGVLAVVLGIGVITFEIGSVIWIFLIAIFVLVAVCALRMYRSNQLRRYPVQREQKFLSNINGGCYGTNSSPVYFTRQNGVNGRVIPTATFMLPREEEYKQTSPLFSAKHHRIPSDSEIQGSLPITRLVEQSTMVLHNQTGVGMPATPVKFPSRHLQEGGDGNAVHRTQPSSMEPQDWSAVTSPGFLTRVVRMADQDKPINFNNVTGRCYPLTSFQKSPHRNLGIGEFPASKWKKEPRIPSPRRFTSPQSSHSFYRRQLKGDDDYGRLFLRIAPLEKSPTTASNTNPESAESPNSPFVGLGGTRLATKTNSPVWSNLSNNNAYESPPSIPPQIPNLTESMNRKRNRTTDPIPELTSPPLPGQTFPNPEESGNSKRHKFNPEESVNNAPLTSLPLTNFGNSDISSLSILEKMNQTEKRFLPPADGSSSSPPTRVNSQKKQKGNNTSGATARSPSAPTTPGQQQQRKRKVSPSFTSLPEEDVDDDIADVTKTRKLCSCNECLRQAAGLPLTTIKPVASSTPVTPGVISPDLEKKSQTRTSSNTTRKKPKQVSFSPLPSPVKKDADVPDRPSFRERGKVVVNHPSDPLISTRPKMKNPFKAVAFIDRAAYDADNLKREARLRRFWDMSDEIEQTYKLEKATSAEIAADQSVPASTTSVLGPSIPSQSVMSSTPTIESILPSANSGLIETQQNKLNSPTTSLSVPSSSALLPNSAFGSGSTPITTIPSEKIQAPTEALPTSTTLHPTTSPPFLTPQPSTSNASFQFGSSMAPNPISIVSSVPLTKPTETLSLASSNFFTAKSHTQAITTLPGTNPATGGAATSVPNLSAASAQTLTNPLGVSPSISSTPSTLGTPSIISSQVSSTAGILSTPFQFGFTSNSQPSLPAAILPKSPEITPAFGGSAKTTNLFTPATTNSSGPVQRFGFIPTTSLVTQTETNTTPVVTATHGFGGSLVTSPTFSTVSGVTAPPFHFATTPKTLSSQSTPLSKPTQPLPAFGSSITASSIFSTPSTAISSTASTTTSPFGFGMTAAASPPAATSPQMSTENKITTSTSIFGASSITSPVFSSTAPISATSSNQFQFGGTGFSSPGLVPSRPILPVKSNEPSTLTNNFMTPSIFPLSSSTTNSGPTSSFGFGASASPMSTRPNLTPATTSTSVFGASPATSPMFSSSSGTPNTPFRFGAVTTSPPSGPVNSPFQFGGAPSVPSNFPGNSPFQFGVNPNSPTPAMTPFGQLGLPAFGTEQASPSHFTMGGSPSTTQRRTALRARRHR